MPPSHGVVADLPGPKLAGVVAVEHLADRLQVRPLVRPRRVSRRHQLTQPDEPLPGTVRRRQEIGQVEHEAVRRSEEERWLILDDHRVLFPPRHEVRQCLAVRQKTDRGGQAGKRLALSIGQRPQPARHPVRLAGSLESVRQSRVCRGALHRFQLAVEAALQEISHVLRRRRQRVSPLTAAIVP
jgi:hypothetical protein